MELIETPVFTRQVARDLGREAYRALQFHLLRQPEAGPIIPGSGGLRKLQRRRQMREDLFQELRESVRQMKAIEEGRLEPSRVTRMEDLVQAEVPNVAALRKRFDLSQAKFAALLGISVGTLQNWEQNRRQPEGPAKVLLRVAAVHPEVLLSVAREAPSRQLDGT